MFRVKGEGCGFPNGGVHEVEGLGMVIRLRLGSISVVMRGLAV